MTTAKTPHVPAGHRLSIVTCVLLVALPPLATGALYLPGGVLMPARLAMLALLGVSIVTVVAKRAVPAPRTLGVVAVTAGIIAISGIIGLARFGGGPTSLLQASYIGIACLAAAVVAATPQAVMAWVWGWLATAAVAGLVGLWEILTAHHLPGNAPAHEYAQTIPGWNEISSFFDNPNLYAYFCTVTLLLIPIAWSRSRLFLRISLGALAALVAVNLIYTDGRLALLTAAFGLALWIVGHRWGRWTILAALAVLGLTMALQIPPGSMVWQQAAQLIENLQWGAQKSSGARLNLIRGGWWMAEQTQFLGVGPGHFGEWAARSDNPYPSGLTNPHSGLAEILAEYGLPSLLALVAAIVIGVAAGVRALRAANTVSGEAGRQLRMLATGLIVLAITVPIISNAHSTWLQQPLTAVHLACVVSLAATVEATRRAAS